MKTINCRRICAGFFLASFTICASLPAGAAGPAGKPQKNPPIALSDKVAKSDAPINITADRMEVLQEQRTVIFEGHVLVTQEDSTITGNRLRVVGLPGDTPQSGITEKIDYIEVEGDVKVVQQDRVATAEKAIFYQKDQRIVLRGNPVVSKGRDKVSGELITIFLKEGRSIVEGGKVPVKAVLFPGKKE